MVLLMNLRINASVNGSTHKILNTNLLSLITKSDFDSLDFQNLTLYCDVLTKEPLMKILTIDIMSYYLMVCYVTVNSAVWPEAEKRPMEYQYLRGTGVC